MSEKQLGEITAMLEGEVRAGKISGVVAAISRHGRIGYLKAIGKRDREADLPMETDTIFRIASMTKAITSAAVMMLIEDGNLKLDTPVDKILPEFKNLRVLKEIQGSSDSTVPANRHLTIKDLLTHTSGLTYGWFGPEKLDSIYRRNEIPDLLVPIHESMAARVRRISKVPLKFQPGSNWEYGVSIDVLGRVIEQVSGLTLKQFFYERFFRPLKMGDTHFYLPHNKNARLAALYTPDDEKQLLRVTETPIIAGPIKFTANYCQLDESRFYSGGGGLVSTITDYLRFLQMLLSGGELDGVRILSRETVAQMTRNQIGNMRITFQGHGDGFGFGFGIKTDRENVNGVASVGTFSWGGIFNTYYWVDPQEQLIGILMTQVYPYSHLKIRQNFKQLTYEAIDNSGFQRIYWYEKGAENANPHFNSRQLRVNSPEASVHPRFSTRSEPRSSGMARILIDEDLRTIRRVDLYNEIWGGHPGTIEKQVSVNGRSQFLFPEVGSADHHCTHQYPSFNLKATDLVKGYNSLQFSCSQGDTFWGHYIVDNAAIKIGLSRQDEKLRQAELSDFNITVKANANKNSEKISLKLQGMPEHVNAVSSVHYQGRYFGYDENGNGRSTDWHGMTKARKPYGMIGSSSEAPFLVEWDTSMIPAQGQVEVRAFVRFTDMPDIVFTTAPLKNLVITKPSFEQVTMHGVTDLPKEFWSRAGRRKECIVDLDMQPKEILNAELNVVAWTGGAGNVEKYFTINGVHFPVAEGSGHEVVYSRLQIDPEILRKGENTIVLMSDTQHHGIEILKPGPVLVIRRQITDKVKLTRSSPDESAGGLDCYKIETPQATYYLDKVGAGLSSMIDREGNDWLGFHPEVGSGASGEYRGFPNAVFKEQGSYFHPRNKGTDPCVTMVEEVQPNRVVISALSGNGLWAGKYVFTPEACIFTLTKMPPNSKYWVLYEGTPGGKYEDSDWWMTSDSVKKHPLTSVHANDIKGEEWIAFGDRKLKRILFMSHFAEDEHPDRYYQMQKKMTVFGFGRSGMKKYLDTVPQSFAIGFVESTDHAEAAELIAKLKSKEINRIAEDSPSSSNPALLASNKRKALERYALRSKGSSDAGKKLFFNDQRTKCSVCHRVDKAGGEVGPNLTTIGGKFDRPHLIESLLEPSRQIVEGFRSSSIITNAGKVHSGIVKSRDANALTLVDVENRILKIDTSTIEEQVEMPVSIMPEGLAEEITPQEFADLIAYLESLSTGKAKFGSGVSGPIRIPDAFVISTVATGLTGATALEVLQDGRVLVCEQPGRLRVVKNGKLLPEPFVTLPVENYWERGLIGVTVAPEFPVDPYVYVVYVADDPYPHHRVSRFRADGDVAVVGSEEILLRGDDQRKLGGNVPAGHQGGAVHFGNDGKLYIGIGEQTAKTPAQKFDTFQGKLLRINPDGTIPSDNPFLNETTGKYQAIWAIGCRNPFTFAVQKTTGTIYINDVGGKYEEINLGISGANYGWPNVDHGPVKGETYTGPIHIYPQASISGGDFSGANPSWLSQYRNQYFFADFVHGWIKTIDPDSPSKAKDFASGLRRVVDLRFSSTGALYVLLRNAWVVDSKFEGGTGSLLKIEPRQHE